MDGNAIQGKAGAPGAARRKYEAVTGLPNLVPGKAEALTVGPGFKWGYELLLNTQDLPGRRRAGTGAWAVLFNTHFFIDRSTGICASIYTNSLPFITRDQAWQLYGDFEEALYAAL
jgi:hypothetical protein